MGKVYQGRYKGKDVAVKFVRCKEVCDQPAAAEAFEREAMFVNLRHPNLIQMIGFDSQQKLLCMV
jgi:hypothetical protein